MGTTGGMVHPWVFVFLVGVVLGGLIFAGGYGRLSRRDLLLLVVLVCFAAGAALVLALPVLRN